MRCVGVADAAAPVIGGFSELARRRGLVVTAAPHAAVAHDAEAVPRIGVARHADGSFVVLDGEVFPVAAPPEPDAAAAGVLDALRRDRLASMSFEGMVTWWDARRGTVTVLGDQIGAVPIAFGRAGTSLVWSTEHRDLLAAGVAPVADPDAVALLAAIGWVPPPITYLRDAEALPAGRMATLAPGREPVVTAWFRHTALPATPGDADAQADAIGTALVAAVDARSGGGRLGALLSAGIDSAAIVAVLRRALDLPVETFTFRYLGYDGEHNEDAFAAETARILGASHSVIPVAPADLADDLPGIVRAFGSPVSFGLHSFKQHAVRDAGIEVMLTGADPGGWYGYGRSGVLASTLWRLPARARLWVERAAGRIRSLPGAPALHWSAMLANHGIKNTYLPLERRRSLVGDAADHASLRYTAALARLARDYADEAAEHRPTFVSQTVGLYDAEWNTRWGRAFGYPIRAPYYDPAVALAVDRRRPWDHDKAPLRRYAATLLPPERAYAPKIYQEVPLAEWLRGPLRDFLHDSLNAARIERSGTMATAPVQRLIDEHLGGVDHKWPLWQLLTTVEWGLQLRAGAGGEPLLARRG